MFDYTLLVDIASASLGTSSTGKVWRRSMRYGTSNLSGLNTPVVVFTRISVFCDGTTVGRGDANVEIDRFRSCA
ncbi:unnamed protein product [Enterobius vermicularis]|uniref:MAM domain-containing protein n=1 Tax=Enterobius vermicularis TaxID=51028 RepID=A0A0N4V148_ENTVE|nr:unnamed protein product [Enterobius vermicularis]